MIGKRLHRIGLAICFGAFLGGCAQNTDTAPSNNSQMIGGGVIGAAMGAGVGALVGHNVQSALIGAAAGGVAGGLIGHALDARDKARREAAIQQSLAANQQNQQTTWVNPDTGDSGVITPLSTYSETAGQQTCREFNETYTRNGQNYTQKSQACLQPDGTWKSAQS